MHTYNKTYQGGLLIYDFWGDHSGPEIGFKTQPVQDFFSGRFPECSYRILSPKELENRTKSELKIMRNEIFARYGYTFKPGREMAIYFAQQNWYRAQHQNVNPFLTELEKENIRRIRQAEGI